MQAYQIMSPIRPLKYVIVFTNSCTKQQAESVPVARDRLDAGIFVTAQMLAEKGLQQWTDQQWS